MAKLKLRYLLITLTFSLSGCVAGCEEVTPERSEISDQELILVQRTHQDNFLSDMVNGRADNVGSAVAVSADGDIETIVANMVSRSNKIDPSQSVLLSRYMEGLGFTGSDLTIPTLTKFVGHNGFYKNLEGLKLEELKEKSIDEKTIASDLSEVVRSRAAIALSRVAMGHNVHHKGGPFGIPALITALQDNKLGVRQDAAKALRVIANVDFNYNPIDNFDDRALMQGEWKKWWTINENQPRSQWLIDGFKNTRGAYEVATFDKPECVSPLIKIIGTLGGYHNDNAADILTHLKIPADVEVLDSFNEELFTALDNAKKDDVKHAIVVALINLNNPIQINKKKNSIVTELHTLAYNGRDLEACIEFLGDWNDIPRDQRPGGVNEGAAKKPVEEEADEPEEE